MKIFVGVSFLLLLFTTCRSNSDLTDQTEGGLENMYFPPNNTDNWETKNLNTLGWKSSAVPPLYDYLEQKNTKSFIVLYNGRIVLEKYFGTQTAVSSWYWASAGKTLTATMVGIAEQNKLINLDDKVSTHLGIGWTSETLPQENLIKIKNLLTMTSGLDDSLGDKVDPANLKYKADAGKRWAYHNVYVKLQDIVANSSQQTWTNYFNTHLRDRIGMSGSWLQNNENRVYWSSARSMARFGLLYLNKGNWNGTQIIHPNFVNAAINTSQNINLSYGYLWWLNGKTSYHLPQTQAEFPGNLIPSAPKDLYCALGKNDQKLYISPAKNLVIVRMGESADGSNYALSGFDEELWQKINAVIL
jgi:CubicO group peptidase (beta-lactamase class C family)